MVESVLDVRRPGEILQAAVRGGQEVQPGGFRRAGLRESHGHGTATDVRGLFRSDTAQAAAAATRQRLQVSSSQLPRHISSFCTCFFEPRTRVTRVRFTGSRELSLPRVFLVNVYETPV